MYLRSLEIHGFKSFPDKIKLEFDKGITAVVGPNGSGKSNIGDAVRWVLGEQSSKMLRGAKMEDVIFAGSEMRRPMGFASVTLCIANDDRTLDIDKDEISVTRKLYRSGESEYMINGANVRLKDISELFMDTGLGRDGYSIVGQGKVAEIVSSKSSERRSIFEEAAGISRSRYKKEDAENRLVKAEDNIVRLEDILRELRDRVGPLKTQSEKAEKFIVLADRRKLLEITVWMGQCDEIDKKITALDEKLLINQNEYNTAESETEQLEQREQKLSDEINLSNIAIERVQNEISENTRIAAEKRSKAAVLENDILHLNEKIDELNKRIEETDSMGTNAAEITEKKRSELAELRAKIDDSEHEIIRLQEKLLSADERREGFDSKQNETEQKLNALYIKRTELTAAAENARRNKESAEEELTVQSKQLEEYRENLSSLENEGIQVDDAIKLLSEKTAEQQNKITGLQKLYDAKNAKYESIVGKISECETEIRVRRERAKILTDLENSMEGYSNASKQLLKAAKGGRISGICGTVSQLISVDPEYSTAIETALGAALQNIVTEDENTAKKGIRFLKDMNAGRATFLPITSVKGTRLDVKGLAQCSGFVSLACDLVDHDERYSGIVDQLLGRTAVAEDIDCAGDIAKRFGYKFRIVTLDGQVVNAGGSYTGGSVARSAGILTRKNEIERIDSEIAELEDENRELRGTLQAAKDECERFGINIAAAKEDLSKMQSDMIRFETEKKRIAELKGQIFTSQKTVELAQEKFRQRSDEVALIAQKNEQQLKVINADVEELLKQSGANVKEREALTQRREEISQELSAARITLAESRKDSEQKEHEIEELCRQIEQSGDLTEKYRLEVIDHQKKIDEIRTEIDAVNESLAGSDSSTKKLTDEIAEIRLENSMRERDIVKLRADLRELGRTKEQLSSEKTRLEERKTSAVNEQDRIALEMQETYDIYIGEAREMAIKDADLKELESELVSVRNKIRNLGTVNLAAIEEYKEVSARYEELNTQLDDVNRSRKELIKLIEELTLTMQERFKESFYEINTHFKRIFTELFGGGRAELSLTDESDVLTSGIEIKVAPPGKVIGSLSLLSGGEQAFVAIAIYFAILRVHPAPFCILDEIEAALDDVNVSRYAQYLHKFTNTTQFITITHRRGTMEEADVFYGVTMQDKGISRLLRMEQKDIDTAEIVVSD